MQSTRTDVHVTHGSGVEVGANGFCEAVWDGDFEKSRFDQTDVVFGSGAVAVDGYVEFVSSASTVDRLHYFLNGDETIVSNSLACLLSQIEARLDPNDTTYFAFFESIIQGLNGYEKSLATSKGPIQLQYYHNLRFDGDDLQSVAKPKRTHSLETFEQYIRFLSETFERLGSNLADSRRNFRLSPLATISTGYDSTACAAIGRFAGLRETLSISRGRGNVDDDGSAISQALGLKSIVSDRQSAITTVENIPLFIASDAKGEDIYFAGSADHLRGRFLISGYSGSRVWDTTDGDFSLLKRGDQSGLSHTEARLHLGYIHCPTPFVGGMQQDAIRRLGRLEEMKPWSLNSSYDRPLCRRILEEAGVPREAFGQEKKAASVLLFDRRSFLPDELLADYSLWLHRQGLSKATGWPRVRATLANTPRAILRAAQRLDPAGKLPLIGRLSREGRLEKYAFREPMFDYLFPWALEKTVLRYRDPAELPPPAMRDS